MNLQALFQDIEKFITSASALKSDVQDAFNHVDSAAHSSIPASLSKLHSDLTTLATNHGVLTSGPATVMDDTNAPGKCTDASNEPASEPESSGPEAGPAVYGGCKADAAAIATHGEP